jgi:hypothetical protein
MEKNRIIETEIIKAILIAGLLILSVGVFAKSHGKLVKYHQVTDKEVLMVTGKGVKVLFSAYDNATIGITVFNQEQSVNLVAPSDVKLHDQLTGSMYVEEMDELMQISTTTKNGLKIKVEKNPMRFVIIDKENNLEIILENEFESGLIRKDNTISFQAGPHGQTPTAHNIF